MAGGMDFGTGLARGARGRKPLDAAINLVPFIDLMAVTISFLLLTAVWTQTGRIEVSQEGSATPSEAADARPAWHLYVSRAEVRLNGAEPLAHGRVVEGALFTGLADALRERASRLPAVPRIVLHVEDDVPFDDVVRAMDACLAAGLEDLTISG